MKLMPVFLVTLLALSLVGCSGQAGPTATSPAAIEKIETPTLTPGNSAKPLLKTAAGDFVIDSARFVNEINGVTAGPGEKILLVLLRDAEGNPLDPGTFSLEAFDKAMRNLSAGEVHLSGAGGAYAICSMAGWIGEKYDQFAMGFRIAGTVENIQFVWPGNEPIAINP